MKCLVTGNPCGTDTRRLGDWCKCANCERGAGLTPTTPASPPDRVTTAYQEADEWCGEQPPSPPELCPDCQRPRESSSSEFYRSLSTCHRVEFCVSRGGPTCEHATIARLRLELSKAQGEREHLEEARFVLWLMLNPNSEHPLQPSNWRAANWLKAEQELQAQAAQPVQPTKGEKL